MSDSQETSTQHNGQPNIWAEVSEVRDTTSNETQHVLQSTQIQIDTQQNTDKLKQDIARESFCNYMAQNWTPLESQSQEIQNLTQQILWPPEEAELTTEQKKYNEIKSELVDALKNTNIPKIISSVSKLLKEFLKSSSFSRKMDIRSGINYTPNENDKDYLINAIGATLDPEKRSRLTYLLWKIKDEEAKENLKQKGIDEPSQFQLFLQNCKPWQLILTNAESTWAKWHATFSRATQIVSWARRCHAAVISDVKEKNWVITDATMIQATWEWIEEISLKECFKKKYKYGDFLLWTFQPPEKWDDVVNSCKSYIWWKYSQINLVADTILNDPMLDKFHISKQTRNKYCSELVFTWMQEAWLQLPDPHTTPADLLSTNAITPEYCCYCDFFW